MQGRQAVVIGSGVAGLAVAIRLAVQGIHVSVFEKNSSPGGKISVLDGDGFRFDAGPSLFVQPGNILELFRLCGENPGDHFEYVPLNIACRYFFENGITINAFTNPEEFAEELYVKLGEEQARVKKYLARSGELYESLGTAFINNPIHLLSTWFKRPVWSGITKARPSLLFQTLNKFNQGKFRSEEAIQIFNRFATYNGSDPYRAPAMLNMISHLEQNQGSFFPKGGMIEIANSLFELACRKGVRFHFNCEVKRIITQNMKVAGVVAGEKEYPANIVVSNADIYNSYRNLLSDPAHTKRIGKQEPSSSAAVFYWGMNKSFERLWLHNIFFSGNYRQEFQSLFKNGDISEDPTVYVNITSKIESGHAPAGKENWFVLVNAPAVVSRDWTEQMKRLRSDIIRKLERILKTQIEPCIEFEASLDPADIEKKTGSHLGALYGISSNSFFSAFRRHPNYSSHLNGLYFCGGTVHPGGGIPLCLKSAEIVAGLVEKDFQRKKI